MGWTGCFPRGNNLQGLHRNSRRSSPWIPPYRPWPRSASTLARKSFTSLASADGRIVFRRKLKRLALVETFKKLSPSVVGMETCLGTADAGSGGPPYERNAIADADTLDAALSRKLQDINWADVAGQHCPDLYQLLYRSLSSDGTHATINSLDRFVIADANMEISAFKAVPDTNGLVEALSAACLVFISAVDPFAIAVERQDVTAELSKQIQVFATLPDAFPGRAAA